MNSADPVVSPLRQRMLDDMRMRKLGAKTQTGCGVRRFAMFLAVRQSGRVPMRSRRSGSRFASNSRGV